ncbi:MAG: ribonucleotide-diphosphate reductase subunit alpha, partial [Pseudomonadota bacterium]
MSVAGDAPPKGTSAAGNAGKAIDMDRKDAGSDGLVAEATAAMTGALAAAAAAKSDSKTVNARRFTVVTDNARDANLTEFGKETLKDRYLLPGENFQDLFARVA